jgi:hypothetical protein
VPIHPYLREFVDSFHSERSLQIELHQNYCIASGRDRSIDLNFAVRPVHIIYTTECEIIRF